MAKSLDKRDGMQRLRSAYDQQRGTTLSKADVVVIVQTIGEATWDWFGNRTVPKQPEKRVQTEHDYDPHFLMVEVARLLLPNDRIGQRSLWPNKHCLDVCADLLTPKEGYGNWTPTIPVTERCGAN